MGLNRPAGMTWLLVVGWKMSIVSDNGGLKLVCDPPKSVRIEITTFCNLKCKLCFRRQLRFKQGRLSPDLFRTIVDQAARFPGGPPVINATGLGEPLVHTGFFDMVRYAADKGLRVASSTNCTLLDEKRAVQAIESGLHRLNVSIDGVTQNTLSHIRPGVDYETVKGNVVRLMELKRSMGADGPHVQAVLTESMLNRGEIARFRQEWGQIVDSVIVKPMTNFSGQNDSDAALDWWRDIVKRTAVSKFPVCPHPWRTLALYWDGSCSPCTSDGNHCCIVGNVREQGLLEIWNSQEMQHVRRLMLDRNFDGIAALGLPCRSCSLLFQLTGFGPEGKPDANTSR